MRRSEFCSALYEREQTGRGQVVDISMFESAVSWLGYFPHHYWHRGEEPQRVGMRHHYITPYGPYLAADGKYVNLAVATESDWATFCRQVIERADLLEDSRFSSPELRRKNRKVLEEMIEHIFLTRGHEEWLRRLADARLPYGRVNGIAEVLAHPQVAARHLVRKVDSPVGPIPVVCSPLRLSDSAQPAGRIPALGGDTEPLLHELGYTDADIAQFRRDSVI